MVERPAVSSSRHIAIFTTSLQMGGAERVAINISGGLADRGFSVDLVLVSAHGRLSDEVHPEVNVVDLSSGRVLTSIPKLAIYLRRQKPDVLYSMMPHNNVAAHLAKILSQSSTCHIPSEHNMPTSDITSIKDVLLLCFSIPIHRHADHSIAVSEGVRKEISRIARLTSDDISVVYNPIVTDRLKESAAEPPDHPWFDEEVTTLVSTGRHVEQKGFDVLVRAFAIVREQVDEDIRLLIFGDGPDTEQYRDIAEECGIAEFVAFPGFVNNIFSEMAAADIFVLSSRWEGFGNVVVEAMACGTQIVSTDCQSGPAEILANGKYGTLTEVDNPQPLAEGILSHLKQSHKYSVEERAEKFTTSEIARKYAEIFEAVSSI